MTQYVRNEWTREYKTVTSNAYRTWQNYFPNNQVDDDMLDAIDWDKKVYCWLKFDCLEKFDSTNLIKTFIDQICRIIGKDDNNVELMGCEVNEYVNTYSEGKIYYMFSN